MTSIIKNVFVLGGLLLILALGYYLYVQNKDATLISQNEGVSLDVAVESAQFLQRLNELQTIQLSNSLFLDPRFKSFRSYSGDIVEEPLGQDNPFGQN